MADIPPISADQELLGGAPVFTGTRVPVSTLWDYLEAGSPLVEFLDHFPTVSREQAVAVMELARKKVASDACSA